MKFSIIIPCYNVEKYIAECLDSLLIQKETSWEALCTNDGSTDRTGAILDEYAQRDSRIKVIHQENKGLSEARNAALALATGEWLCYLDSDDLYSPWALETYARLVEEYPQADILRLEMVKFEDGAVPNWSMKEYEAKEYDVSQKITQYGIDSYFPRMIFRRDIYGDIPFVGMSWCEERPYVAKCIVRAKRVVDCSVQAYTFRVRKGSITHRKMTYEQQKGYLDATRLILRIFKKSGRIVDKAVLRMYLTNWLEWTPRFILEHLDVQAHLNAWKYYFASLKEASEYHNATLWRKFTILILRIFPVRGVAIGLCYLPDYLKRKGFHR